MIQLRSHDLAEAWPEHNRIQWYRCLLLLVVVAMILAIHRCHPIFAHKATFLTRASMDYGLFSEDVEESDFRASRQHD